MLCHSYWNLLSKVIHTEIVLLTRREVFLVSQYLDVPLLRVQKCFHPRMDWEQWGGEIKARLVAQGVYAKPRALIFKCKLFSIVNYKISDTNFWLEVQKHLSLQLIDVVITYDRLIWYIVKLPERSSHIQYLYIKSQHIPYIT